MAAWNSGLTKAQINQIERVQKCALAIILEEHYVDYNNALETLEIESLSDRRTDLCLKFATKSLKHNKYSDWFCSSEKTVNTRIVKQNLKPVHYRLERFNKSPLSYLTRLLNSNQ